MAENKQSGNTPAQTPAKATDQQKLSAVQMLEQKLRQAPNLKSALQMGFVQNRYAADYQAATGKKDGMARFLGESLAYMGIVTDNPALAEADRWQHFAALIKGAQKGLSFKDGRELYVMPGKNKTIKVQSSPLGKRKQLESMPTLKKLPEPQLVMVGDKFVHDRKKRLVTTHETTEKSATKITLENIFASYQTIEWADGIIEDVVVYQDDLFKARAKSPAKEAGLWQTLPGEAAKKTSTNRTHRLYYKEPDFEVKLDNDAEEEETQDTTYKETQADFMPEAEVITAENGDKVDTSSGEVVNENEKKEETKGTQKGFFND